MITPETHEDCKLHHTGEVAYGSLGVIDRIGVAFCKQPNSLECVEELQDYRAFRLCCLATTLGIVEECRPPQKAIVCVRLKRLDSIRRKLIRINTQFKLGRLDDVIGVRVICQSLLDLWEFVGRIKKFPGARVKDYVANPSNTGYRGIHCILAFEQRAGNGVSLRVRFEIQVRTHLQHLWAVWSESHGDSAKVGAGRIDEQIRLHGVSKRIAKWERNHPDDVRQVLPDYVGGRSLAVCWRSANGPTAIDYFADDITEAVKWLNYLEERHPERRQGALLLVGVTTHATTEALIKTTHPLYAGVRVRDPIHWLPND